MKKATLGIIGAGWIGDWYFDAYSRCTDRFHLVGAAGNPSPEGFARLEKKCAKWGNIRPYATAEELIADPSIQAIAVFSPNSLHFEQVKMALEAGKHVLVEKPVTLDVKQDLELEKLAEKKGLIVFPGHNFVYRPVDVEAKKIIESGRLGNISYGSFRACHFIPPEHSAGWRKQMPLAGGGAMMDSGTHLVYQSIYLLGLPKYISCFSTKKHYLEMDGEDTCLITVQYASGTVAQIFQSWSTADDSAAEVRIQGDKGVLLISDALYFNGKKITDDCSYANSFYHTLEAFYNSIETAEAPVSTIHDAANTLSMIQTAYQVSGTRKIAEYKPI
ncbi:MAG: Gfo/Idh/MocA family oxidoreductase [Spirochaetia bacterium]|jgi:predicted dehydrogenase|nr:Gfo/Idh/MocA family oxidoreductase [Spirochaetia bacterium]